MFSHLTQQQAIKALESTLKTPQAQSLNFFGDELSQQSDFGDLHQKINQKLTCTLALHETLSALTLITEFLPASNDATFDVGDLAYGFFHQGKGQGLCERDHFEHVVKAALIA